jgi:putative transposase
LDLETRIDLLEMLERYSHYGWSKQAICRKWDISVQSFYQYPRVKPGSSCSLKIQLNKITPEEKALVRDYALSHTELNHRELAWRMIDEDIVFMSPSSVYRIFREYNLLVRRKSKPKRNYWDAHKALSGPDEVWQTDLMVIHHRNRDYYLLSYMDVYSRFIVYYQLCTSMTGDTIQQATQEAFGTMNKKPKIIQSDNGSCYISSEYRQCFSKTTMEHRFIHPHCPNENAEIERYHRTLRELVDPYDAKDFDQLCELVKKQIEYYNYQRYHSGIGFVPPWLKYIGKADSVIQSRKQKLHRAKQQRMKQNWQRYQDEIQNIQSQAA